jgi:uncharacterized repeat protein (TIGR01451 family)
LQPALGYAATPFGTVILNTTQFSGIGMTTPMIASVLVHLPSAINFLKYNPSGMAAVTTVGPVPVNSVLCQGHNLSQPAFQGGVSGNLPTLPATYSFSMATVYQVGEPVFFEVDDASRNLSTTAIDTLTVVIGDAASGDSETLTLSETSVNSGQFIGFINTSATPGSVGDCQLHVNRGDKLVVKYGAQASSQVEMVDPYGVVFDSATGVRLSNARVSVVDAVTGAPVSVVGDDGESYPNILITGQSITTSKLTYNFGPGEFRFPFIPPGNYRLLVDQLPAGYTAPTVLPNSYFAAASLLNGPYLVGSGSRQDAFTVAPGPPQRIDIPLDTASSGLFVVKTPGVSVAAVGDFVPYTVQVSNTQVATTFANVHLQDRLPAGFRYRAGTLRVAGVKAADPVLSADGRNLDIALGLLAASSSISVSYITEVTAATRVGQAVNVAQAVSGAVHSNQTSAAVTVREDLMRSRALLIGRVLSTASCDAADMANAKPVPSARIYTEDGRYVLTDIRGRWHFDDIRPGSHVVQLDKNGLPANAEILSCEKNTRAAGNAQSRFVDVQGGTLWQVDFYIKPAVPLHYEMQELRQKITVQLTSTVIKNGLHFTLRVNNPDADLGATHLQLKLPASLHYLPGSFSVNGVAKPDQEGALALSNVSAQKSGNVVSFDLAHASEQAPEEKNGVLDKLVALGEMVKNSQGNVIAWDMELDPAARVGSYPVMAVLHTTMNGQAMELHAVENEVNVVAPEKIGRVIIFRPHFDVYATTLSSADQRWLNDIAGDLADGGGIRLDVVGHTDNVRVVPRAGRIINDNYALSAARAQVVANFLRQKLNLPEDRVKAIGRGADEPMADNKTAKGRNLNRRVELKVYAVAKDQPVQMEIKQGDSGEKMQEWTQWVALPVAPDVPGKKIANDRVSAQGVEATATTVSASVGSVIGSSTGASSVDDNTERSPAAPVDDAIGLLSLHEGAVLANRIQALRVRVDSRLTADISVDGKPIPNDRLGFRKNEGKTTLMSFIGVDLGEPGAHTVTLLAKDTFGNTRLNQSVHVSVAGEITRLRAGINPDNVADGRSPVQVKIELLDGSGHLIPAAVDLRLVSGELRPLVTGDAQRAVADSAGVVSVSADGLVKFAPVTRSGLYNIELSYNNTVEKIPVFVHTEKRDWILVGLAEGSAMEKTLRGNMQSAADAGQKDDILQDGRVAFFAKGQVRGNWLLTMAYDSKKQSADTFGGAINSTQYYTLYADASAPSYDAASKKKLYLRIEKDAFYAVFGDVNTGMTVTELGRYNRTLTGFKSEYHDQYFDVNVFAADSSQGYVNDEQRGNGTSGIYKLRSKGILAGSERIRIETRDRYKSEVVLNSQQLGRYSDYSIDYDTGEIFFKMPIPSQDANFNPVWIVAEYEVPVSGGASLNAGGRAAVKLLDGKAVVGVSAVQENAGLNKGDLQALDAEFRIDRADVLRAEVATSSTTNITTGAASGSAQLVEWKRDSQKIKSRVYYRQEEAGFGLGQQNASEDGTRKIGAEGRYQFRQDIFFTGDVFQQQMLNSGSQREVAEVRSEYSHDAYAVSAGLRHADESIIASNTETNTSVDQLTLGGRYNLTKDLKLRANGDLGINGQSDTQDFPNRLLLGADYQVLRNLQVSAEEEWTFSDNTNTQSTRAGVKYQPWQGANLNTNVSQDTSEAGERLRSGLGLGQRLVLTPEWTMDMGYDRADTLKDKTVPVFNPTQPPVFGNATAITTSSDFWAAYTGANYQSGDLKGVGRIERREASDVKQWNVVGGAYQELNPETAIAAGLTATLATTALGATDNRVLLRGSLALRPDQLRWIFLEQLDYGLDRQVAVGSSSIEGHRLVNNLNASRRWEADQLSVQYGAKFVLSTIDSTRVSGYTDLMGAEWRHDLNERWDIGWRHSVLHSWQSGVVDYSYGISVGVTPMRNAWISLGFNFEGFKDADFSGAEYSAKGVYLKMRLKVDQDSLKQIWNDTRGAFN